MAFNPFSVFRKNQKVLFALLTVVVMFMFVLSSGFGGGADFFDWFPRMIGSKARSGEVLAKIGGSKVYESDLQQLQTKRTLANQYMAAAGSLTQQNLARQVSDSVNRVSAENRPQIQNALAMRPSYVSPQMMQMVNQFMTMGRGMTPQIQQMIQEDMQRNIAGLRSGLAVMAEKAANSEDKEVAQLLLTLVELDLRLASIGRQGQYFTNLPYQGANRDLMAFKLWLTKAESMDISFTDADVAGLVDTEFQGKLTDEDRLTIENMLRNKVGYNPELLKEALADEFKVRLVQTAVLGQSALQPLGQAYDAPYDYYQFYKDQTSTARYGMITVPTENYVSKVQATPSESELRELFTRHKNDLPNPVQARPGFKEPRKVKLEWLEATGTEPFYKQAAAEGVKQAGVMSRANGFLSLLSSPGGIADAALLAAAAPLAVTDPVLATQYANYRSEQAAVARDYWYGASLFTPDARVMDRGFLRPEHASAVAGVAGPAGEAFEMDRKARVQTLPAALIAPLAPGWGVPSVMIATAAAQAHATEPMPLDAVRARLIEDASVEMARVIAEGDLRRLQDELTKLSVDKADSEAAKKAREFLATFVKERGLKTGQSQELRDQYHIGTDPGLQPILEKARSTQRFHGQDLYMNPAAIGERFFVDADPMTGRSAPSTGLYEPQPYLSGSLQPTPAEPVLMVWRIADQPAASPRNFDEARAKVEAAWKELKARELARKDAEELAAKSKNLGGNFFEIEPKLMDLYAQYAARFDTPEAKARVKYFKVDDVAPVVVKSLPSGAGPSYSASPFNLTPTENIPYPSAAMQEALIKARDEPVSHSLVVSDSPEDRFYVAVLLEKSARDVGSFKNEVYDPRTSQQVATTIDPMHQFELQLQVRERALDLIKAELGYEKLSDKAEEASESFSE